MKEEYKELTTYQRAYRLGIDVHHLVDRKELDENTKTQMKGLVRDVIGSIADAYRKRDNKTKRFHNFLALDKCHTIMVDLDFLHDTSKLTTEEYEPLYMGYDSVTQDLYKLNQRLLSGDDSSQTIIHPTLNNKSL